MELIEIQKESDRDGSTAGKKKAILILYRPLKRAYPHRDVDLSTPRHIDAWTRVDGQANLCAAAARTFLTPVYSGTAIDQHVPFKYSPPSQGISSLVAHKFAQQVVS